MEKVYSTRKCADDSLINEITRCSKFLKYSFELRCCLKVILVYLSSGITKDNSQSVRETLSGDTKMLFSSTVQQLNNRIDEVIECLKNAPTIKQQEQARVMTQTIKSIRSLTRESYNDIINQNMMSTIDKFEELDSKGKEFFIEAGELYLIA